MGSQVITEVNVSRSSNGLSHLCLESHPKIAIAGTRPEETEERDEERASTSNGNRLLLLSKATDVTMEMVQGRGRSDMSKTGYKSPPLCTVTTQGWYRSDVSREVAGAGCKMRDDRGSSRI